MRRRFAATEANWIEVFGGTECTTKTTKDSGSNGQFDYIVFA